MNILDQYRDGNQRADGHYDDSGNPPVSVCVFPSGELLDCRCYPPVRQVGERDKSDHQCDGCGDGWADALQQRDQRRKFIHSDFFRLWPERFPLLHLLADMVFPWLCWYVGMCTGMALVFRQALTGA